MYFANLEKAAIKYQRPIVNIPPQAYVPIPMGIEKLAAVVEQNIK
jgi:PTS system cellobiose-specific IIB component